MEPHHINNNLLDLILRPSVPRIKPTAEQVYWENERLSISTKKTKQQIAHSVEEILYRINNSVGLIRLREFLLSQTLRAQLSFEDQIRINSPRANDGAVITIGSRGLKWYSSTFSEELPKHFDQAVTQQLCPLLSEIDEMQTTYFTSSGRFLVLESRALLVMDSEYGILSKSEQNNLLTAALTKTGYLDSDSWLCNIATALTVRKSLDLYENAVEESLQGEVEEEGSKSSYTEHGTLSDLKSPCPPFVTCARASPPPFELP